MCLIEISKEPKTKYVTIKDCIQSKILLKIIIVYILYVPDTIFGIVPT